MIQMHDKCLICDRIAEINSHKNPYFVKELETGYVVLGDYQFFEGYTLFICKKHVLELHDLDDIYKQQFLNEMSLVAKAVFKAFEPLKLNYELLGNTEPHLHWHIFPRHKNDPLLNKPVWSVPKNKRYNKKYLPSQETLKKYKHALLNAIESR